VWINSPAEDLTVEFRDAAKQLVPVVVNFVGLAADFDGDDDVDGSDFLKWQRGFPLLYDATQLANWTATYGTTAPASAATTPVPEPAALLLAGVAAILVTRRRIWDAGLHDGTLPMATARPMHRELHSINETGLRSRLMRASARLVAFIVTVVAAASASAQPKPNVILILSDDQGWTGTSAQMDPNGLGPLSASDFYETPNLEMLATQGMRFRQAYSAAPNCSPTRASIQTGMSPAALNLTDIVGRGDLFTNVGADNFYAGNDLVAPFGAGRLPVGAVSIAQRIKDADAAYVTAHFGKWHLTTPAVQPSTPGGAVPYRAGDPSDYGYDVHDGARANNPINSANDPKEMFSMTNRALDFVDDHAGVGGDDRPFYMQISHYAVHDSSQTLAATKAKYDAKFATDPGIRHPDGANNTTFAGMTEDLDTTVGQIMTYLDSTPDPRNPGHVLADNTYLFYIADNGATEAQTSNLPLYDEKASTWEGGIRVPLIVRGPGIAAGAVSSVPVVSTDLYATISSLTGATAPLPAASESADLTALLNNSGVLPNGVDSLQRGVGQDGELFFHFPHYQHDKGTTPMSGMVDGTGQFKLVRIYGAAGQPTQDYLFDMNVPITDPLQTWEDIAVTDPRNLANNPAYAGQLASMQQKFDGWIQDVDASLPYEIATPVAITWDANDNSRSRGLEGPDWRSVTDVDQRSREQWLVDETGGTVSQVAIAPAQAELGTKAFHVDAGAGFKRTFFHVSELDPFSNRLTAPADANNSATFEFWLRADALDQGQLLLETGGTTRGLSISLGNADGDGQFDDVRLRASDSSTNQAIVVTASLAATDVTSQFVHLVAVIDENALDNSQAARIYLNGVLAAESDVVLNGTKVDWDGSGEAGLGMIQGGLGAANGPGLGALGTTGFAGDIAQFSFFNYALTSLEVEKRFQFDDAFILGDLDGNGMLDPGDVARFKQNWLADTSALGLSGRHGLGDIDGNGAVELMDWLLLRDAFVNAGQAEVFFNQVVPEPPAILMAAILAVVAAGRRIRFRRR
ncbi:MAG: sulfatase-like hydrolase/transferase, partial [Planctomycetales bacterium]|nr:sulfatase-like hydrolase/transferase [Planctomycetales bacterium]